MDGWAGPEERKWGSSDQGKEEEKQIQLLLYSFKHKAGSHSVSSKHPGLAEHVWLWDTDRERLYPNPAVFGSPSPCAALLGQALGR